MKPIQGFTVNVAFENLNQIPKLITLLEELIRLQKERTIEKKWLSVDETAYYLGYSKHKVYKMIQEEWIKGCIITSQQDVLLLIYHMLICG